MNGSEPEIGCLKCGSDEQRLQLSGSDLQLKHNLSFDQKKAEELFLEENTLWDTSRALSIFSINSKSHWWVNRL